MKGNRVKESEIQFWGFDTGTEVCIIECFENVINEKFGEDICYFYVENQLSSIVLDVSVD